MNNTDRWNIEKTARGILNMAYTLHTLSKGDKWYRFDARQAYKDSLEAMKYNHLILDYCIPKNTLTLISKSEYHLNKFNKWKEN